MGLPDAQGPHRLVAPQGGSDSSTLQVGGGQEAVEEGEEADDLARLYLHLLAERFKFTQQVGRLKAAHQLPPSDPEREKQQIARLRSLAEAAHLDPVFAEKFLTFIVAEVIRHHEQIAAMLGDETSDD